MCDMVFAPTACHLIVLCLRTSLEVACYFFDSWEGHCLDFLFL